MTKCLGISYEITVALRGDHFRLSANPTDVL